MDRRGWTSSDCGMDPSRVVVWGAKTEGMAGCDHLTDPSDSETGHAGGKISVSMKGA